MIAMPMIQNVNKYQKK